MAPGLFQFAFSASQSSGEVFFFLVDILQLSNVLRFYKLFWQSSRPLQRMDVKGYKELLLLCLILSKKNPLTFS